MEFENTIFSGDPEYQKYVIISDEIQYGVSFPCVVSVTISLLWREKV